MRIPRWLVWLIVGLDAVVGVAAIVRGQLPGGIACFVTAGVLAFLGVQMSGPEPHTPWSPDLVQPGRAVVFWKDGCGYCHRLIKAAAHDERITWVNVYKDKAADAEVRRHNDGNQLTPTALVGEQVLINPSADELLAALDED